MNELESTLKSRTPIYGPYGDQVRLRQNLRKLLKDAYRRQHKRAMPRLHEEYLWDLVNKLTRLAITPDHEDTWLDIGGYSQLILNDIRRGKEVIK